MYKSHKVIGLTLALLLMVPLFISYPIVLRVLGSQGYQSISAYGMIRYGWLHTDGRWIKDSSGNIIRLMGANMPELMFGLPAEGHIESKYDLFESSGGNVIRYDIEMKDYIAEKVIIDESIQWCKERDIYFILSLHHLDDYGYDANEFLNILLNPEPFYQWWEARANEFKDNPTVCGFDFMNEPPPDGTGGYTRAELHQIWRNVVINATRRIHAINPNVLIFVENIHWSSMLTEFIENPLNEPNVVYCLHRYYHYDIGNNRPYALSYAQGDFETGYLQMKTFYYDLAFKLLDMGYPVILEELGAYREDPDYPTPAEADPYYLEQLEDVFKMVNEKEVGFLQWAFGGKGKVSVHWSMLTDDWSALNEVGEIWAKSV